MKYNKRIRTALAVHGVPQWRLAQLLEISEFTLSRKLREELPEEEQEKILALIREEGEHE